MPSQRIFWQCPRAEYPQSIPAMQNIPAIPYPAAEYLCSAQPQRIPAVANCRYPCKHPQSIPAAPDRKVSLQFPNADYRSSARPHDIPGSAQVHGTNACIAYNPEVFFATTPKVRCSALISCCRAQLRGIPGVPDPRA